MDTTSSESGVINTGIEGWEFEQVFKKLSDIIAGKKFGSIRELEDEIKKHFGIENLKSKDIESSREEIFIFNVILDGKSARVKIILTKGIDPVFRKIELLK